MALLTLITASAVQLNRLSCNRHKLVFSFIEYLDYRESGGLMCSTFYLNTNIFRVIFNFFF